MQEASAVMQILNFLFTGTSAFCKRFAFFAERAVVRVVSGNVQMQQCFGAHAKINFAAAAVNQKADTNRYAAVFFYNIQNLSLIHI